MLFNTIISSKGFKRVLRFIQYISYAGLRAMYLKEWWAEIQALDPALQILLTENPPPFQTLCHVSESYDINGLIPLHLLLTERGASETERMYRR